jgi:hypothetical protein
VGGVARERERETERGSEGRGEGTRDKDRYVIYNTNKVLPV